MSAPSSRGSSRSSSPRSPSPNGKGPPTFVVQLTRDAGDKFGIRPDQGQVQDGLRCWRCRASGVRYPARCYDT